MKTTREQMIKDSIKAVKHARSLCDDVEFSPEDSTRAKVQFNGSAATGKAASTDVIEASAKAYLNGVNKVAFRYQNGKQP